MERKRLLPKGGLVVSNPGYKSFQIWGVSLNMWGRSTRETMKGVCVCEVGIWQLMWQSETRQAPRPLGSAMLPKCPGRGLWSTGTEEPFCAHLAKNSCSASSHLLFCSLFVLIQLISHYTALVKVFCLQTYYPSNPLNTTEPESCWERDTYCSLETVSIYQYENECL